MAESPIPLKSDTTFQDIINDFGDNTTAHGIPRVITAKNLPSKFFWICICLCAFSFFIVQSIAILEDYLSYPTTTKVELVPKSEVHFPSVTVCNMNRFRKSALKGTRFEDLIKIDGGLDEDYEQWYEPGALPETDGGSQDFGGGGGGSFDGNGGSQDFGGGGSFGGNGGSQGSDGIDGGSFGGNGGSQGSDGVGGGSFGGNGGSQGSDGIDGGSFGGNGGSQGSDGGGDSGGGSFGGNVVTQSSSGNSEIQMFYDNTGTPDQNSVTETSGNNAGIPMSGVNTGTQLVGDITDVTTASPFDLLLGRKRKSLRYIRSGGATGSDFGGGDTPGSDGGPDFGGGGGGGDTPGSDGGSNFGGGSGGDTSGSDRGSFGGGGGDSGGSNSWGGGGSWNDVPGGFSSYYYYPWWYQSSIFDWFDNDYYGSVDFEYDAYYDWGDIDDVNDWSGIYNNSMTEDFSDVIKALNPTKEELMAYGHQAEDFILQCTFDKRKCNYTDFMQFQNLDFGNCYTFNHGTGEDVLRQTSQTGAQFGLHLTLLIEQPEYVGLLSHDVGVRVSIHPPTIAPHPEDTGIAAETGTSTSIGLRQNEISRLSGKYGNCSNIHPGDTEYDAMYHYEYSYPSCKKLCIQEQLYEKCGCVSDIYIEGPKCDFLNRTQQTCQQLIETLATDDKLDCKCPLRCHETSYITSISTSLWPSERYQSHLYHRVSQRNTKAATILGSFEKTRKNLVRLKVFFEELNFQSINEVPIYSTASLLGSLGGLLGLYIGLSTITMVEIIILFFDVIRFTIRKIFCRNRVMAINT